jgi:hypothetical protein
VTKAKGARRFVDKDAVKTLNELLRQQGRPRRRAYLDELFKRMPHYPIASSPREKKIENPAGVRV